MINKIPGNTPGDRCIIGSSLVLTVLVLSVLTVLVLSVLTVLVLTVLTLLVLTVLLVLVILVVLVVLFGHYNFLLERCSVIISAFRRRNIVSGLCSNIQK